MKETLGERLGGVTIDDFKNPPRCIDCEHFYRHRYSSKPENGQCGRTAEYRMEYNYVTGETEKVFFIMYCSVERDTYDGREYHCGPEGRFFKEKVETIEEVPEETIEEVPEETKLGFFDRVKRLMP